MDLFEYARSKEMEKESPLAVRLRPRTLEEVVGQQHIIGKDKMLYRAIKADKLSSIIFYGPPGTGKTTLAKVIANTTSAEFTQVNATVAGKKDMEEVVKKAKDLLGMYGKRTILFVDEIHRFNKGQQDYLLPFVEDGTLILIGATTENPYFEVNSALISRSVIFQLDTIAWLLSNSLSVGIMAAIVIFQPELRRALEQLGRKNFFRAFLFSSDEESGEKSFLTEKAVNEIVRAAFEMSKVKTGALIVIEQKVALGEYERTGIAVDGIVSSQLLINIFEHNTPLHDGAVIIRGSRIVSATCYLPLTDSMELGKELGTRHRAAVGISEVSDSTTVVVSEETGAVSVAREGQLYRNLDREALRERLNLLRPDPAGSIDVLKKWKGLLRSERPEKFKKSKKSKEQ